MDAVADVVGVCLLMDMIAPDSVIVSPVHVGKGHVHCAHGILPVPAPATSYILRDVPVYSGSIEGELCTPTGAALLKYFADSFGDMPVMRTEKTGYGIGTKEFPRMNCVRAFLGQTSGNADDVAELVCNIDDMTGEDIAYACDIILSKGALDVFTVPVNMKKCRPGVMLTCICRPEQCSFFAELILRHTSTIGVRESICRRYTLSRSSRNAETPYGTVKIKDSSGYGVSRSKAEFDDVSRIARENDLSLAEVRSMIDSSTATHN